MATMRESTGLMMAAEYGQGLSGHSWAHIPVPVEEDPKRYPSGAQATSLKMCTASRSFQAWVLGLTAVLFCCLVGIIFLVCRPSSQVKTPTPPHSILELKGARAPNPEKVTDGVMPDQVQADRAEGSGGKLKLMADLAMEASNDMIGAVTSLTVGASVPNARHRLVESPQVGTGTLRGGTTTSTASHTTGPNQNLSLIEDVVGAFTPSVDLVVKYGFTSVTYALWLTKAATMAAPNVVIGGDPSQLYTLIMCDPDVAGPATGQILHWIVANIPGGSPASLGTLEASYSAPDPITEPHRYVLALFCQPEAKNMQYFIPLSRKGFQVRSFATDLGLGDPVNATFFMVPP